MTAPDKKKWSEAAAALLRQPTEAILSPKSDQAHKINAVAMIFGQIELRGHGVWINHAAMAEAMAAALLRMELTPQRERTALGFIARHLGDMEPAKAADASFIAARHVQYVPWAMMKTATRQNPSQDEMVHQRKLEQQTTTDWVRQMDRLGRADPTAWAAQRETALGASAACTLLRRTAEELQQPAALQRHNPVRTAQAEALVA